MIPATHRMSLEIFSALAEGMGGGAAIAQLAAVRRSRNLLLIRTLVDLATVVGHDDAPVVKDAYRTLSDIEKLAPGPVESVLNYPSVSAWVLRTVVLLHEGRLADAQPAQLAAVAASAAVRGAVATTVDLPVTDEGGCTVELPSLGVATFPTSIREVILSTTRSQTVLFGGDTRVEIPRNPYQNAPNWTGIRRISAECDGMRIRLLMDTLSSHYLPEIVTVHEHLFDQQVVDMWQTTIAAGWKVLVRNHREVAAEVAAAHTMLVPLRGSVTGQVSVTLSDAFGCVAMSLPLDPRFTALTLAHEVQHAKLSVLMDLFPLMDQRTGELFYAPWRDDPRPLTGLLQGTYAHFGVAAFWRRQRYREEDAEKVWHAEVEFARWCEASREVAHFLVSSRRLTLVGQKFVAGMLRVLDEWSTNHVSRPALEIAQQFAEEHRKRWQQAHGQAHPLT